LRNRRFFYACHYQWRTVLGSREACRFLCPVCQPDTVRRHLFDSRIDGLHVAQESVMNLDFPSIAQAALRAGPGLLMAWLPGGRLRGNEYDVLNPTRADQTTGNFRINILTGKWADFATGDAGGDWISLRAYLDNSSQSDAADAIAHELGLNGYDPDPRLQPFLQSAIRRAKPQSDEACLSPVPEDAPPAPLPAGRSIWTYLDQQGRLLGYVTRVNKPDGSKDFFPMTYWTSGWQSKSWPRPRPLYNQSALIAAPDLPVLVVEGEKAADAAMALLPGFVAITWPGGSSSVQHADWTPLTGRCVWLLPDADAPGMKAMVAAGKALHPLAAEIYQAELPELPSGWDIADWESTEQAESAAEWVNQLTWLPIKAPSVQDDRFADELRRANGQGPRFQVADAVEAPIQPLIAPLLAQLEQEILARVPLRCTLAAQVTVKAVMAHLVGRQAVSQAGDPAILYLAMAAPSAGDIRPYLKLAFDLMEQLGLQESIRQQRVSSQQQLHKLLWRQPNLFYLCSEWGILLQFAKRQPAGSIEQTLTALADIWDGRPLMIDADEIKQPDPGASGAYVVRAPHLTLLAALSHEQLTMALKLSEMGRGALEQIQYWILHEEEFSEAPAEHIVTHPFPDALLSGLRALATPATGSGNLAHLHLPDQMPDQVRATFPQSLEPHYAALDALPVQRSARALKTSARLIARREATGLAFCLNPTAPVITSSLMESCVASEVGRLERLLARFAALSSEDGKLSAYQKVLDFITTEKRQGVGERSLQQSCWAYRNLADDKREALIKQLLADGAIVEIQPPSKPGARRKALVYVAKAYVREVVA